MLKIINILFCFLLIFLSKNLFCNELYQSKFYHIEIETKNAEQTKNEQIDLVKIKSLKEILKNILNSKDIKILINTVKKNQYLDEIIQNIIIENELIIKDKYIADVKINFNIKEIIKLIRKYNIDYTDLISENFLIIASYKEKFLTLGLSKKNFFYQKNKKTIQDNNLYLINFIYPSLNTNDRFIIPYKKIENHNLISLNKIATKYNANNILILNINKKKNNTFDVKINHYLNTNQQIIFLDKLNVINENRLQENIFSYLNSWWKTNNKIDNSKKNKIICHINANNFYELIYIRKSINDLTQLISMNLLTIELNNNIEEISFHGDFSIFEKNLKLYNINIIKKNNCIINKTN